jgi:vitamin B12 transporter
LNYRPTDKITVNAVYRYTGSRFDAGYDADLGPYGALARIDVDAYHLADVGMNWNVSDVFSVAFKIENVLDEDYREVVGFQTRGRSAYLKLAARF